MGAKRACVPEIVWTLGTCYQGSIVTMPKKFKSPNGRKNGEKRGKTGGNGGKRGNELGGSTVERSWELPPRPCPCPLFAP